MIALALAIAGLTVLASAAEPPAAPPPADPFAEAVKVCGTGDSAALATLMATLKATPLSDDEVDEIRLGQDVGLAYGFLVSDMEQSEIDIQPKAEGNVTGWVIDRIRVLDTTQSKAGKSARICAVVAPYDKFDTAVSLVGSDLRKGRPDKRLSFSNHKVAAWSLEYEGPIPRYLVLGADFGGDRKATSVQIVTK